MPKRNHCGTDKLRHGRSSAANARYFITLCTENQLPGLNHDGLRQKLTDGLRAQQVGHDFDLHCATIMPDHLHLLFTLGTRLTLSQVLAKFKRWTAGSLQDQKLHWQSNFYDHRLRQDKALESFARYIFLNPYRKKLIGPADTWAGWICNKHYRPEFTVHLVNGQFPPKEWLAKEMGDLQELIEGDRVNELEKSE